MSGPSVLTLLIDNEFAPEDGWHIVDFKATEIVVCQSEFGTHTREKGITTQLSPTVQVDTTVHVDTTNHGGGRCRRFLGAHRGPLSPGKQKEGAGPGVCRHVQVSGNVLWLILCLRGHTVS